MLRLENIATGYGKKQVIYDVSLEVKKGEIVLLTGGNGSGKSTLLKAIYGLLPVWHGKVIFNDEDITNYPTSHLIKKGLIYIPQKNNYFENLTVEENLRVSGQIYDKKTLKKQMDRAYELPKLYDLRKRKPFNLSGGEKQLMAFGCALIHEPQMILFDEPLAGMDRENSTLIRKELSKCKERNISLIFIEHQKSEYRFLDHHLWLQLGKINGLNWN